MSSTGDNVYLPGFVSRAFPVASLFGVKIRVSISIVILFLALTAHAVFKYAGVGYTRAFEHAALPLLVLALFLCMFLHELGHAALAKLRGFQPLSITLSFVGLTSFERKDARPADEWLVAIGGPLVNLIIGAGILSLVDAPGIGHEIDGWHVPVYTTFQGLAWWVGAANLAIAAFNMLPLFPLDGSRVALGLMSGALNRSTALRVILIWSLICGGAIVAFVAGALILDSPDIDTLYIVMLVLAWVTMSASVRALAAMRVDQIPEQAQPK